MSIIETAKSLLRKGIALNDHELIEMANSLLGEQEDSEAPVQPEQIEVADRDLSPERGSADEFVVDRVQNSNQRRMPVNQIQSRKNEFADDGTEHTEIVTPSFTPTERRKPSRKVKQTCTSCKEVQEVSEVHSRDFYVCDECLGNRRR
jgi:hypothetical protein|tara:strand:- start:1073 stop:1516 length:444 start_codon:yes stop_codon:yes gene_type:complete